MFLLPYSFIRHTHTRNVCVNFHKSYSFYKKQEKPLSFSSPRSSPPLLPPQFFPSLSQHLVQGSMSFVIATALAWDLSWTILHAAGGGQCENVWSTWKLDCTFLLSEMVLPMQTEYSLSTWPRSWVGAPAWLMTWLEEILKTPSSFLPLLESSFLYLCSLVSVQPSA